MNLCTVAITNYVRSDQDWIVEVSYRDFKGVRKMRPIGVSRCTITPDDAVKLAVNSLGQASRREGWKLPPQVFSCIPKRRIDWKGKYDKQRTTTLKRNK